MEGRVDGAELGEKVWPAEAKAQVDGVWLGESAWAHGLAVRGFGQG